MHIIFGLLPNIFTSPSYYSLKIAFKYNRYMNLPEIERLDRKNNQMHEINIFISLE